MSVSCVIVSYHFHLWGSAFATISLFRFEMSKEFARGFSFCVPHFLVLCGGNSSSSCCTTPNTNGRFVAVLRLSQPVCIVYQSKQYKSEFGAQHYNKVCHAISSSSSSRPAQLVYPSSVCKQDTRAYTQPPRIPLRTSNNIHRTSTYQHPFMHQLVSVCRSRT